MFSDWRAAAVAALALVAAPALAGCLTAQASAMDHEPTATDRAEDWDEDAALARIVGIEGSRSVAFGDWYGGGGSDDSSYGDAGYWSQAEDDDEPGDGLCEIWVYTYVSPNKPNQVYHVVVDKDGEVLENGTDDRDDEEALSDWELDSDEASDAAFEENEGLRTAVESDNYGIVFVLQEDDDYPNPVWLVAGGGGDSEGGGGGVAVVDAVTGEILASHSGSSSDWGSGGWGGSR